MNGRTFSNHVRWCDKNTNSNKILCKIRKQKSLERYLVSIKGQHKIFQVQCSKCHKKFKVKERQLQFPRKKQYHCSRKCANSNIQSQETKLKISNALYKGVSTRKCLKCGKPVKKRKYCSVECRMFVRKQRYKKTRNERRQYKIECKFNFSIKDYPNQFDIQLIKKYGWYKAKNRGNNLNGVSRDHMISITYGFKNKINPQIIRHPANCKLMQHKDNQKKNVKNLINLQQLMKRIKIWNDKYYTGGGSEDRRHGRGKEGVRVDALRRVQLGDTQPLRLLGVRRH